jgi:hypothetical protein
MKNSQTRGVATRFTRISTAGLLIAFSGTAVALAEEPAPSDSGVKQATKQTVISGSAQRASAAKRSFAKAVDEKKSERKGIYSLTRDRVKSTQPQVSDLSDADLLIIAKKRAAELVAERHQAGGVLAGSVSKEPVPVDSNQGNSSGPGIIIGTAPGGLKIDHMPPGPGSWDDNPNLPAMGVGFRNCYTHEYWSTREFRSNTNNPLYDPSTSSFVNGTPVFGVWPILPPPSDAPDLDGDGAIEDPLPQRPVVVYFQFLEEGMTDIEWDEGDDNFNMIGLRTDDNGGAGIDADLDGFLDDPDGVIDVFDLPDDTDGLSDTWLEPFVNVTVLPPADPADFDPAVAQWLQFNGLGNLPWGNGRPIFPHPDAEAAWRLAQREYFGTVPGFTFENGFNSNQVLEPEERALMLVAMQAISDVANIIFIERADGGAGFAAGYPYAPKGYSLDADGILVDEGAFAGLHPGDIPYEPDDDYPWILIAKGDAALFTAGQNFATTLGPARTQAAEIDYTGNGASGVFFLFDINGDGFPDTPDLDGDGLPDQIIFSNAGLTTAGGFPTGLSAFDNNNTFNPLTPMAPGADTQIDANDSSVGNRVLNMGPGSVPLLTVGDLSGDGFPEMLLDPDLDGDPDVIEILNLQLDSDGDLAGDSMIPGGANPSAPPVPFEIIPCELLNISQEVLTANDAGVMVHEMMHHLGFIHEQQRPDRNDFVRINPENVPASQASQFTHLGGGTNFYANMIDNFDTTVAVTWGISGTASSGAWAIGIPVDSQSALGPAVDFAVDEMDLSATCAATGLTANETLVGETILTSTAMFGPSDGVIRFAYWLASDQAGMLGEDDGLFLESSNDNGLTWSPVLSRHDNSREWREVQIEIGDILNDSDTTAPDFMIRFTARNNTPANAVEVAVDRIRVQNPYDFLSIMHYGTYGFSILPGVPGFEVIEVLPPLDIELQDEIGNQNGLSAGDRRALRDLFGAKVVLPGDPDSDPCRADINQDGIINGVDIALFLEAFNAGDLTADFAPPEGVIDIFDMVQFFNDFQQSASCVNDPTNEFGANNFTNLRPPG